MLLFSIKLCYEWLAIPKIFMRHLFVPVLCIHYLIRNKHLKEKLYEMQHPSHLEKSITPWGLLSFTGNFFSVPRGTENFDLKKMLKQTLLISSCLPAREPTAWTQELNTGNSIFVLHCKDIRVIKSFKIFDY